MHALIETIALTDTGVRHDFGLATPPDLSHKTPSLKWVPVIVAASDPFDPATQKLVRQDDITIDDLTERRVATALTAQELADLAQAVTDNETDILAELDLEVQQAIGSGPQGVRLRALIELLNKRDNFNTNRIIELQNILLDAKNSTGGVANLRAAIPASFLGTATRSKQDAINDYKADIAAGNQNT